MIFFNYNKCSTCIKARKFLEALNIDFISKDAKLDKPNKEDIKSWYEKSGLDIKKFFNTSGNVYKELGLKDKLAGMSLEDKLSLLASDGMLVKRPILVMEDRVLLGFKEKEWEEALS
jgi:transcriptional regulator, Spx/MgsR family